MSFDIEPENRTDPISKEEYYELRLRPVKDYETGVTVDEIDRMEFLIANVCIELRKTIKNGKYEYSWPVNELEKIIAILEEKP